MSNNDPVVRRIPPSPTHQVVDIHSETVVGKYSSLKRASHAANKKDLEYGGVRYIVRRIP